MTTADRHTWPVPARAAAFFEGLGATTEAVAASLDKLKVRGWRGQCSHCPIAVAALQEVEGLEDISVGTEEAELWFDVNDDYRDERIDLPPAVQAFVLAFDHGQFPGLQQTTEVAR